MAEVDGSAPRDGVGGWRRRGARKGCERACGIGPAPGWAEGSVEKRNPRRLAMPHTSSIEPRATGAGMKETRRLSEFPPTLLALRLEVASLRMRLATWRLTLSLRANFDPKEPRWPKGSGRISGQWRNGGRKPLIVNIPGPGLGEAARDGSPKQRRLQLPKPGIGHNGGPPLEDPPELPRHDPGSVRLRRRIAKRWALWLLRALGRVPDGRARLLARALEAVGYLAGFFEEIKSALDEPRSLDELRRAVETWRPGTHVHHIVEKVPAEQDGFPQSMVEGYDNKVRIPTYRHEEISAWYQRRNPSFGWQSPRNYLKGRSWDERMRVGIDQLRREGLIP